MRWLGFYVSLFFAASLGLAKPSPAPKDIDAAKVIKDAESIRSVDRAKLKVSVVTITGKQQTFYDMDVLQAPVRRAYIEFTSKEESGRRMLALKTLYWSKFPDSKRIISISRREAIGNSAFAIADIFQMDVDDDYSAKLLGTETMDKTEILKLELNAKHVDAPYHRIIYYVKKADHYPIKAEFFGPSGQMLKTMTIESSAELAGRQRPKVLKMVDHTTQDRSSTWTTKSIVASNIPDAVFTKDYLRGR